MSRPAISASSLTRRPIVLAIAYHVIRQSDEHEREDDDHAERLVAELRERARVDEAAVRVADAGVLREARRGEQAAGERAPDAREAVRREHADRVVELLVDQHDAGTTIRPPTMPMIGAAQFST